MIEVEWAGEVPYTRAWEWQKALVAERTEEPERADKLLLMEHPPTYTLGRSGSLANLLWDEITLAQKGITLFWVDRGGNITYHGPGQLVGYPILNLKRLYAARGFPRPDLHFYLRDLEEVIIRALAVFGVPGRRFQGYTGVWIETTAGPRKIAAIGIKVSSRGISCHGFALNVDPDMEHFAGIIPCGIQEHGVTSLSELLKRPVAIQEVLEPVITAFRQVFLVETVSLSTYNG